jgi:SM-20-related protein
MPSEIYKDGISAMTQRSAFDLERFRATALAREPFDHVVVPDFIRPEMHGAIARDFPRIEQGGSFPLSTLDYGSEFAAAIAELRGPEMQRAFEEKFSVDLSNRPIMITARGVARAKDGQIHVDSRTKILTLLIYMNPAWQSEAGSGSGHLRLLRSAGNIDDFTVEVPPAMGTLIAFRCGPQAWHGHLPFEGARRSIQLNWVTDAGVVRREEWRHRLSALTKRLLPQRHASGY